ncbi:MAG: CoA synthetase, partial [Proteobacteria bacterium]|nr:CoA synthetase [Pseudomonadota bacterium]
GLSETTIHRPGGPESLVTGMAVFDFDRANGRFRLASTHLGHSVSDVRSRTGFSFDLSADVPTTAPPDARALELLRGPVREQIAEIYPSFVTDRMTL